MEQQQILDTITKGLQDADFVKAQTITKFIAGLIHQDGLESTALSDRGDGLPRIHMEQDITLSGTATRNYLAVSINLSRDQHATSRNLSGWSYIYQVQSVLDAFKEAGYFNF